MGRHGRRGVNLFRGLRELPQKQTKERKGGTWERRGKRKGEILILKKWEEREIEKRGVLKL